MLCNTPSGVLRVLLHNHNLIACAQLPHSFWESERKSKYLNAMWIRPHDFLQLKLFQVYLCLELSFQGECLDALAIFVKRWSYAHIDRLSISMNVCYECVPICKHICAGDRFFEFWLDWCTLKVKVNTNHRFHFSCICTCWRTVLASGLKNRAVMRAAQLTLESL